MLASDLHVHLDGSLREKTLAALLRKGGLLPQADRGQEFAARLRFTPGMSLRGCLARFDAVLGVLQTRSALLRAAEELVCDSFLDGVRHAEVRLCPLLHTREGLSPDEVIGTVLDGIEMGRQRVASSDPDGAMSAAVLVTLLEGMTEDDATGLARLAVHRAAAGVIGVDLAGDEALFDAARFRRAFGLAREGGLGVTIHAGEGHDPSHVRDAVLVLGARRIGHGTSASSDERTMELLAERGVTVEVCLSSNLHTGAVERLELHPLPRLIARNVRVTLATDNRFFSATTLSREYDLAARVLAIQEDALARMADESAASSFLPEEARNRLLATVRGARGQAHPSGEDAEARPPTAPGPGAANQEGSS